MATNTSIGIISPVPADEWSESTSYQKLNIVRHDGASYVAKIASTNIEPGTSAGASYWMLITQDGTQLDDVFADDTISSTYGWTSKQILDALCPEISASGGAVACHPVKGYPLGVSASFEPSQSGSGDPSPSNVRQPVSRTGATVTRCGKNMLNLPDGTRTASGITATAADGVITLNGTATASYAFSWNGIITLPAGTYTLSANNPVNNSNNNALLQLYADTSHYYTCFDNRAYSTAAVVPTSTLTYNLRVRVQSGFVYSNFVIKPQLEVGASSTDFEQYTGGDFSADWSGSGAVYSGTANVTAGTLAATHGVYTFTGGETVYTDTLGGAQRFYTDELLSGAADAGSGVCSCFSVGSAPVDSNDVNNQICAGNNRLYWRCDDYSDAAAMKAFFAAQYTSGSPIRVVYELSGAAEYSFSAAAITSLGGTNTLFFCDGTVDVDGRQDLIYTIEQLQS